MSDRLQQAIARARNRQAQASAKLQSSNAAYLNELAGNLQGLQNYSDTMDSILAKRHEEGVWDNQFAAGAVDFFNRASQGLVMHSSANAVESFYNYARDNNPDVYKALQNYNSEQATQQDLALLKNTKYAHLNSSYYDQLQRIKKEEDKVKIHLNNIDSFKGVDKSREILRNIRKEQIAQEDGIDVSKLNDFEKLVVGAKRNIQSFLDTDESMVAPLGSVAGQIGLTFLGSALGGVGGATLTSLASSHGLANVARQEGLQEQLKKSGHLALDKEAREKLDRDALIYTLTDTASNLILGGAGKIAKGITGLGKTATTELAEQSLKSSLLGTLTNPITGTAKVALPTAIGAIEEGVTEGIQGHLEERMKGNEKIDWTKFGEDFGTGALLGGTVGGVVGTPQMVSVGTKGIKDIVSKGKEVVEDKFGKTKHTLDDGTEVEIKNTPKDINQEDLFDIQNAHYNPSESIRRDLAKANDLGDISSEQESEIKNSIKKAVATARNNYTVTSELYEEISNDVNATQEEINVAKQQKDLAEAHYALTEQEFENAKNFFKQTKGEVRTDETNQANIDTITKALADKDNDTASTESLEVQNALKDIQEHYMSYEPEQLEFVIKNAEELGLDKDTLGRLRTFHESRINFHNSQDIQGVEKTIIDGGKSPDGSVRYKGLREYQENVINALQNGSEYKLSKELKGLDNFLNSHEGKLAKVKEAMELLNNSDNSILYVAKDSPNGAWDILPSGTQLSDKQRAKLGAVRVSADSGKLVQALENEVSLIDKTRDNLAKIITNHGKGSSDSFDTVPNVNVQPTQSQNIKPTNTVEPKVTETDTSSTSVNSTASTKTNEPTKLNVPTQEEYTEALNRLETNKGIASFAKQNAIDEDIVKRYEESDEFIKTTDVGKYFNSIKAELGNDRDKLSERIRNDLKTNAPLRKAIKDYKGVFSGLKLLKDGLADYETSQTSQSIKPVQLTAKDESSSKYLAKDQAKANIATQFIGVGNDKSSTKHYAGLYGDKANTGSYTADDVVFVSTNGGDKGKGLEGNKALIDKAIQAKAKLVTDTKSHASSEYNKQGEAKTVTYLEEQGLTPTEFKNKNGEGYTVWSEKPLTDKEIKQYAQEGFDLTKSDKPKQAKDLLDKVFTLKDIANTLKEEFSEDSYSVKLLTKFTEMNPDVQIELVSDISRLDKKTQADVFMGGMYYPTDNKIIINTQPEYWQGNLLELVNHELTHSVTQDTIGFHNKSKLSQEQLDVVNSIKENLGEFLQNTEVSDNTQNRISDAVLVSYPHELTAIFTAEQSVRNEVKQANPELFNQINSFIKSLLEKDNEHNASSSTIGKNEGMENGKLQSTSKGTTREVQGVSESTQTSNNNKGSTSRKQTNLGRDQEVLDSLNDLDETELTSEEIGYLKENQIAKFKGLAHINLSMKDRKLLLKNAPNYESLNKILVFFEVNKDKEESNPLIQEENFLEKLFNSGDPKRYLENMGKGISKEDVKSLEVLKQVYDKVKAVLPNVYSTKYPDGSLVSNLIPQENGQYKFESNFMTAMALGIYKYVYLDGSVALKDNESVAKLFGMVTVPYAAYQAFKQIGDPYITVGNTLGKDIVKALGLKTINSPDVPVDMLPKLESGLGMLALEVAKASKFISINSVKKSEVLSMANDEDTSSHSQNNSTADITFKFVRLNGVVENERGFLELSPKLIERRDYLQGSGYFPLDLFKVSRGDALPSFEPTQVNVPNKITRVSSDVPTKAKEALKNHASKQWKIHEDTYKVFEGLMHYDNGSALEKILGKPSDKELELLHVRERESVLASVEAELQVMKNNMNFVNKEMDNDLSKGFYFNQAAFQSGRYGYGTRVFNAQESKLSRAMVGMAELEQSMDIPDMSQDYNTLLFKDPNNPYELTQYGSFLFALAEKAEGVKLNTVGKNGGKIKNSRKLNTVDKEHPKDFIPAFHHYISKDKDVAKAVQSMQRVLNGKFEPTDIDNIVQLVQQWGMSSLSLRALVELANFRKAEEEGKPFVSSFVVGSDGVTNGPAINYVALGVATPNQLTSFGYITEGMDTKNYHEIRQLNLADYYETGGNNLGIIFKGFNDTNVDMIPFKPIGKSETLVNFVQVIGNLTKVASASRKRGKDILTPTTYGSGLLGVTNKGGSVTVDSIYSKISDLNRQVKETEDENERLVKEQLAKTKIKDLLELFRLASDNFNNLLGIDTIYKKAYPGKNGRQDAKALEQIAYINKNPQDYVPMLIQIMNLVLPNLSTDSYSRQIINTKYLSTQNMNTAKQARVFLLSTLAEMDSAWYAKLDKDIVSNAKLINRLYSILKDVGGFESVQVSPTAFTKQLEEIDSKPLDEIVLNPAVENMVFHVGKLFLGSMMWNSFKSIGKDFINARNTIINVQRTSALIQSGLISDAYSTKVEKQKPSLPKWKKSQKNVRVVGLTKGEEQEIKDNVLKDTYFATPLSDTNGNKVENGIDLTTTGEDKLSNDLYAKGDNLNLNLLIVGNGERVWGNAPSHKVQYKGLGANSAITQSTDGTVAVSVMNEFAGLNVHDSFESSFSKIAEVAQKQNKTLLEVFKKYHVGKTAFENLYSNFIKLAQSKNFNKVITELLSQDNIFNSGFSVESTLSNMVHGDLAKLHILKQFTGVHQYSAVNGGYKVTEQDLKEINDEIKALEDYLEGEFKDKLEEIVEIINDVKESFNPINEATVNQAPIIQELNFAKQGKVIELNVSDLSKEKDLTNASQINTKHSILGNSFLTKFISSMVEDSEGNVNVRVIEDNNPTAYASYSREDGKDIITFYKDNFGKLLVDDSNVLEVLGHEITHQYTLQGILKGKKDFESGKDTKLAKAYKDTFDLMHEFSKSLDKINNPEFNLNEIRNKFTINGELNVAEFVAVAYSNTEVRSLLLNTKVPRADRNLGNLKDQSFLQKLTRQLYKVLTWFKGFSSNRDTWNAFEALMHDTIPFIEDTKSNKADTDTLFSVNMAMLDEGARHSAEQLNYDELFNHLDTGSLSDEFIEQSQEILKNTFKEVNFSQYGSEELKTPDNNLNDIPFKVSEYERQAMQSIYALANTVINSKNSPELLSALRKVYNQASKHFNEKSFVKDWDSATPLERYESRSKYEYLFGSEKNTPETLLAKFIALSLMNQEVNTAMKVAFEQSLNKGEKGLFNQLGLWAEKAMNSLDGISYEPTLDSNVKNFFMEMLHRDSTLRSLAKEGIKESLLDTFYEKLQSSQKDLIPNTLEKVGQTLQKVPNDKVKTIGSNVEALGDSKTRDIIGKLEELRDEFNPNSELGVIAETLQETLEPTDVVRMAEELLRTTKALETQRQNITENVAKVLKESFANKGEDLSKSQIEALHKGLLETDAQSLLSEYSLTDLMKLFGNSDYLQTELDKYEASINNSSYANEMLIRGDDLAYYLATGNVSHNMMLNAESIVMRLNTPNTLLKENIDTNLVNDLDKFISLKAIQYLSNDTKKEIGDILFNEYKNGSKGITTLLGLHNSLVQEVSKSTFSNNPSSLPKGYLPELLNGHVTSVIANETEGALLLKQGYVKGEKVVRDTLDNSSEELYIYTLEEGGKQRYVSGAISTTNPKFTNHQTYVTANESIAKRLIAKDVKRFKTPYKQYKREGEYDMAMLPQLDVEGNTVGYTYIMNKNQQDKYIGRNRNVFDVLGYYAGNNFDRKESPLHNEKILDAVYKEYQQNYRKNPKSYVALSADNPNPRLRQAYFSLPEETRKYAEKMYGKGNPIMVSNKILTTLVGYRKYSIGDTFNKPENSRNFVEKLFVYASESILGDKAQQKIYKAERIWQEIVTLVKDIIVLRNGSTLLGNIQANVLLLTVHGVNPLKALRDMRHAFKYGLEFRQDRARKVQIEYLLKAGSGDSTKLNQELLQVEERLLNNPLKDFIDEGMLSSIVEDVDLTEDVFSFKSALSEKVDNVTNKVPKPMRNVANNLLFNKGSKTHQFMADLTQYSDFAAKYVMYRHKLGNKTDSKSIKDALNYASDAFINYDIPTNKTVQYLNDTGMMMFTKFFFRFQKVLLHVLKHHPLSAALQSYWVSQIINIPTIFEPFFLNRFGNPFEVGAFSIFDTWDEILTLKAILN